MFIIYKVTSPSKKIYIGLTSESLEKRKNKHLDCALHRRRKGKFQNAIRKYKTLLKWKILEQVKTKEEAIEKEIYYIDKYNSFENGYNCTLGGESNFGMKHSNKTKKLMSKIRLGIKLTKKHRKNMSKAQKLHKNSIEVRNQMATARGAKSFLVFTLDGIFIKEYICRNLCARELKLQRSNIFKVLKGLRKKVGKYTFIYKENYHGSPIK